MIKRRPPQHAADAVPLFISSNDDAWDRERIERERKDLPKGTDHPLDGYYRGETRYDIDAPITLSGQTVTIREYLREGSTPTVFRLRRVPGLERQQLTAVHKDPQARLATLWRLAKMGVIEVTDGFNGAPWDLQGGEALPLTDADVQALYEASASLPEDLGYAVYFASAPLSEAEGKR